jgi:hypothetical protein
MLGSPPLVTMPTGVPSTRWVAGVVGAPVMLIMHVRMAHVRARGCGALQVYVFRIAAIPIFDLSG